MFQVGILLGGKAPFSRLKLRAQLCCILEGKDLEIDSGCIGIAPGIGFRQSNYPPQTQWRPQK